MSLTVNPFIYSRPVTPAEFLGRERELRRLFSRLATGQSTAVIGQPHIGKTSLLKYVADEPTRIARFGDRFERHMFSFLDAHTLHGIKTQAVFWERALAPLSDCLRTGPLESLAAIYQTAEENEFGTFVLERLFTEMHAANCCLVLLLDECDDFLAHPVLNSAEFYGGLRSLASRTGGLVLIIAARRELEQLNQLTQAVNPHGSPYFNVFTEISLGPFSKKDFAELMNRGGECFDRNDRDYLERVSGRHPFLAQAAAAILWEAHEEGHEGTVRYQTVGRGLYRETKKHFADTWHVWTNETRKAITVLALAQIPQLLAGHSFLMSEWVDELDDYRSELAALEAIGLCAEGDKGGMIITQGAFLWWLADELRRNVRDDAEFKAWLQAQEMDGLFTNQERQRFGKATSGMLKALGKGATTLIEAFAKGIGE